MELETINKLYLELSQVATARTSREQNILCKLSYIWDKLNECPKSKQIKNVQKTVEQLVSNLQDLEYKNW